MMTELWLKWYSTSPKFEAQWVQLICVQLRLVRHPVCWARVILICVHVRLCLNKWRNGGFIILGLKWVIYHHSARHRCRTVQVELFMCEVISICSAAVILIVASVIVIWFLVVVVLSIVVQHSEGGRVLCYELRMSHTVKYYVVWGQVAVERLQVKALACREEQITLSSPNRRKPVKRTMGESWAKWANRGKQVWI